MKKMNLKNTVSRAQLGEAEAFAELYDDLYDRVYGFSYKRTLDQAVACDVTSNTFIKLIEKLDKFNWRHDSAFYGWVFKLCSSEISDYYRKQSKYRLNTDYFEDQIQLSGQDDGRVSLEDHVDSLFDGHELHRALKKLKEIERNVIELYYFGGMNYAEIASTTGHSEVNVRVISHRSKDKLRSMLDGSKLALVDRKD